MVCIGLQSTQWIFMFWHWNYEKIECMNGWFVLSLTEFKWTQTECDTTHIHAVFKWPASVNIFIDEHICGLPITTLLLLCAVNFYRQFAWLPYLKKIKKKQPATTTTINIKHGQRFSSPQKASKFIPFIKLINTFCCISFGVIPTFSKRCDRRFFEQQKKDKEKKYEK